jgi:hypothetical protein
MLLISKIQILLLYPPLALLYDLECLLIHTYTAYSWPVDTPQEYTRVHLHIPSSGEKATK